MNTQGTLWPMADGRWATGQRQVSRFCQSVLLFLGLAVTTIHAELPMACLHTIFPPGARTGSTVEISVSGSDLDDPVKLVFSNTNLVGIPKPGDTTKFLVTVASN